MGKLLAILWVTLLFLGISGRAEAIPYLDVNGDHSGPVWMGEIVNPSETWVFDLVNDTLVDGDISSGDIIDNAYTRIAVSLAGPDLGNRWLEIADLSFDGTQVLSDVEVDNGFYSFSVSSYLRSDYILSVTISDVHHTGGLLPANFRVDDIRVHGDYTPALGVAATSVPVPEPHTLLLVGFGLLGVSAVGRRKLVKH
jgi:hypothetical protein